MKKFSVKTIVAIGIGAALFFVLGRFVSIPSPVPNTTINVQYGLLAFMAVIYGPIAGALIGGYYQVISPNMGATIGLKAFAAAVVGGIGILHGAVVGGLVVGVVECIAAQYLGSNVRDPMAFVILILILIIKPVGLFGKKGITKV